MNPWVKRVIGILIGVALVFLIGTRVYEARQDAGKAAKKKRRGGRVVSVDVAESRTGLIRENLLLTGSLKAKEAVDVSPKAQGRVEKLYFQVGDSVASGTLIAELDDDELQQQVNRAGASIAVTSASLDQRRAERENVRAELERAEQLFNEKLLSPQDYDAQKTGLAVVNAQVQLAQAQQQQAEAELSELKIRLAQTKVYAPMSGIVANRYVDVGALVSPNTPIMRIVNLSTMVTQGNVPERNIGRLRIGNEAVVRVDAIPDHGFKGRIARIAPVLDAATRSALIEIDILNPGNLLKAEMFTRIELDLGTTREAVLIPREGLVYRGTQPGVYVIDGNVPTFRPIETGLTREDQVEVLANLDASVKIVGRGATMLREGDRVRSAGAGAKGGAKRGAPGGNRGAGNNST